MLQKTKTAIAHCPTSNAPLKDKGLGSGLFDLKKVLKEKIRWALGSDIGAGPYLSMVDVMNSFVSQHKKTSVASYTMAFYRATLAGESILQSDHKRGSFSLGKEGTFLSWSVQNISSLKNKSSEEVLRKLFYTPKSHRADCVDRCGEVYWQGNKLTQSLG